jgi:cytochrome P450
MTTTTEFYPFAAGTDEDPYAVYTWMREHAPVYHDEHHGFYALSRFDDVKAAACDWQHFSSAQGIDLDHAGEHFGPNFLNSDPPAHRAVRRVLQGRFSGKAVTEALELVVRDQVSALLADLVGRGGEFDYASEFAWSMPVAVSCHLLGFPPSDHAYLWERLVRFQEREVGQTAAPQASQDAAEELRAYVAEQVERRRRAPGDDLLSLLVSAVIDDQPLPDEQIIGNGFLLLDAGILTTSCLLTNALVLLDRHRDQAAWLRSHPDRIADAVEEILRFESPIQHLTRTTVEDVEMHGTVIPSGSTVVLMYGASNRDPRAWEEPDQLDLTRPAKRALAFGDGIHHCLGAPIARLEARVTLEALLPHLDHLHVTAPPVRLRSHELRGYVSCPASLASH